MTSIREIINPMLRDDNGFQTHIYTGDLMVAPIFGSSEAVDLNNNHMEYYSEKTQKEYVEYINKNKIKRITVSKMKSLDFLIDCPGLEFVSAFNCYNSLGLYKIKNLKYLQWNYGKNIDADKIKPIDVSKFENLEKLVIEESSLVKNVEKTYWLKDLSIVMHGSKNLLPYKSLTNLQAFSTGQGTFQSLEGIENFKRLQVLSLCYLRGFNDLNQIEQISDNLRVLEITACGGITDYNVLYKMNNLRCLKLEGKIKLPNVDFLKNLRYIRQVKLSYDVVIENKNTLPLKDIYYHVFYIKRGYNYAPKVFKQWQEYPQEYLTDENVPEWRAYKLYDDFRKQSEEVKKNEEARRLWLLSNQ